MVCRVEENPSAIRAAKPEWIKVFVDQSTNTIELGNRIVIQLKPGADLKKFTEGRASKLARVVAPNVFILQAPDAFTALSEAETLAQSPDILASYPVMRRAAELHGPFANKPNDQYFFTQWNLGARNSDGTVGGPNLNVRAAWPVTRGDGVTIAIADVGLELSHVEISPRAVGSPHFNFTTQTTNGLPASTSSTGAHGTEVAGLAAAEMNNGKGMVGVAPGASLASWVIFNSTNLGIASDEHLMDMYQYASNSVAVQNHSWGNAGITLAGPSLLEQIGISNALTFGRFGRGVIMVRSAGNDRLQGANCNDDGYPSDPRIIAVAAVRMDGRAASYSEPGACVLVAAPSGDITAGFNGLFSTDLLGLNGANQIAYCPPWDPDCPTKDLSDYVFESGGFSGTSAAAPQVAGVVALMLSSNTNLTYRDVQQILIFSARQFDFADPDLITNGAGFRVSHNTGFGVPDAGVAVRLARNWINRPAKTEVTMTATNSALIPDDGLRVLISGDLTNSIRTLPSLGVQPDFPTASLPLVDVGFAATAISQNLSGKAALIQRGGGANYSDKIIRAAQAGAAFAVVYNSATASSGCPGGDQLCNMGSTDYVPIPAVFIGNTDGKMLTNSLAQGSNVLAQLRLEATNYTFVVTNTLITEHVGVRVATDHPLRGDLRITLVSPQGTRSILQRYNGDISAGPEDWTYFSTHHFFESSAGAWTVSFGDEFSENVGQVQSLSLIIDGTPITDSDKDGLDDNWETSHFGSLVSTPKDDPDLDGDNNAREQILQTDPNINDVPFRLDLSWLDQKLARLSWPSSENFNYQVRFGTNLSNLNLTTNLVGKFPETEWFTPYTNTVPQFFQVQAMPKP